MRELVAIALPAGPDWVDEMERTWDAGDAVMPIDPRLPTEAAKTQLRMMGAARLIDATGHTRLAQAWPVEDGDALVVATSGTTAIPKGVVITHDALRASAAMTHTYLGVTADDHWLACLPLAHIGGLSVVTRAVITGTKLTVQERFDAAAVARAANDGATLTSLVTTALRRIDASLFRRILLGGGPVPPNAPQNAVATYGMTETASGIVYDGYALDGVELSVDDDAHIWLRSPTLLRCYRDGIIPMNADGWFCSNDAGEIAADGRLTVFGRADDVIISGGEKVWPQTIECVLSEHPNVAAVLVTGIEDPEWGEAVTACVEVVPGAPAPQLEELRELVKANLPDYCAPKSLQVVDHLDRTSNGKVTRRRTPPFA